MGAAGADARCRLPPSWTSPAGRRGRATATRGARSWSTTRTATRGPRSWARALPCWVLPTGGLPVDGGVQALPARRSRPCPSAATTARPATSVPRRRAGPPALARGGRSGDLVPVRRRPPRVPVDRGARPRRRPVPGGAARRCRHPRRPRHLLLPRRAGVAGVVPLDGGPQHRRDRRREPVRVGRAVPVDHPGPDADGDVRRRRAAGADLERRARRLPAAEHSDGAPPFGDAGLARTQPDGRRHLRHRRGGSAAAVVAPGPRRPGRAGRSAAPHSPGRSGQIDGRGRSCYPRASPGPRTGPRSTRSRGGIRRGSAARVPATSLVGRGTGSSSTRLVTVLELP